MLHMNQSQNVHVTALNPPGIFAMLPLSWKRALVTELQKPYISTLSAFGESECQEFKEQIFPAKACLFKALEETSFEQMKVVIMGQNTYHSKYQAHALCLGVLKGVSKPPSLQNIFKELHSDLKMPISKDGNLKAWAQQGVLLLNAILTGRAGAPLSHKAQRWERFSAAVIRSLAELREPVLFVLWGSWAEKKCRQQLPAKSSAYFLIGAHPLPLSAKRGFFGCKLFSKINEWLAQQGKTPIDWRL